MNVADKPSLSPDTVLAFLNERYGLTGELTALDGERDLNYKLKSRDNALYVVKVAHPDERADVLDLQSTTLSLLAQRTPNPLAFPSVVTSIHKRDVEIMEASKGAHAVRVVSYLQGTPIANISTLGETTLASAGTIVGHMDVAMSDLYHPAMHRWLDWDSKHSFSIIRERLHAINITEDRALVENELVRLEMSLLPAFASLPMQVIHNDVNDYNLIAHDTGEISGIIDFGDMVHSYRVCDPAHTLAYLLLSRPNWHNVARGFLSGYLGSCPLTDHEIGSILDFISLRLCLSVTMSAHQKREAPDNEYLSISEKPAWKTLRRLREEEGDELRAAIGSFSSVSELDSNDILRIRSNRMSSTLSTSYKEPLHFERGRGQFLIDTDGNEYLDCVNNVCHVGHCHPRVVQAAREQIGTLNTNTRFLHSAIARYAERIVGTLPPSLDVCFFVNSGSEANDLALRLARTHTGRKNMVVIDHAYHGHTQSLIEISPYKFNGPGGPGKPAFTHIAEFPDTFRGRFGRDLPNAGAHYADSVRECCQKAARQGPGVAGFIAESILGVGGQIVLPDGYLRACYEHTRSAGGVCIADEVQVGFGRVGTHMWAFETQGVCPDIVTLGKPIGNGHPMAAVVTTREIAESFCNGMEYFNTFGGNPVSCRVGLAVLDVIESEGLMHNAIERGNQLKAGFVTLAERFEQIGDIRGLGLFLGVELVQGRDNQQPNYELAEQIIEHLKEQRVLLSTDGPLNNVLKFKPPIAMTEAHANKFLKALRRAFVDLC